MEPIELVKFRCAELEQKLQESTPEYKVILKDLHEKIRETPELLYALDDSQIAIIVAGLSKFTGIAISEAKSKEKISKKQAASLTEDDV